MTKVHIFIKSMSEIMEQEFVEDDCVEVKITA